VARLPYRDNDPEIADLYRDIAGLRGSVHNLHRVLANQPAALRAFMGMSRYVRDDSGLPPGLRELAVLATAFALDVEYEKFHHFPAARRVGVSEEKLRAFPDWFSSNHFSEVERAVLAYADAAARRREVDSKTWGVLHRYLTDGQIADLAVTVGWYHLCAAIIGPLGIETERPIESGRDPGATEVKVDSVP